MAYCHKHGQGLASGRCEKCDDEIIALGIQEDKDRITFLEYENQKLKVLSKIVLDNYGGDGVYDALEFLSARNELQALIYKTSV